MADKHSKAVIRQLNNVFLRVIWWYFWFWLMVSAASSSCLFLLFWTHRRWRSWALGTGWISPLNQSLSHHVNVLNETLHWFNLLRNNVGKTSSLHTWFKQASCLCSSHRCWSSLKADAKVPLFSKWLYLSLKSGFINRWLHLLDSFSSFSRVFDGKLGLLICLWPSWKRASTVPHMEPNLTLKWSNQGALALAHLVLVLVWTTPESLSSDNSLGWILMQWDPKTEYSRFRNYSMDEFFAGVKVHLNFGQKIWTLVMWIGRNKYCRIPFPQPTRRDAIWFRFLYFVVIIVGHNQCHTACLTTFINRKINFP